MFILLMYMYIVSGNSPGSVTSAEFSSREKCELAAKAAEKTFTGFTVSLYHVCIEK